MRIITLIASTIVMWASPALAQDCNPRFVENSQTVTVSDVDVGARKVARESFNVRVLNEGNGPCSASIRFLRLDGTAVSANLEYALRSGSSVLQVLPNEAATGTSQSDLFVSGLPGGDSGRSVPFSLTIPSDWGIESGFHSEQLQLSLLDPSGQVVDTLLLTINVNVPPSVSIRVVGATGTDSVASINLGNITPRDISVSDPFGIRVWSTSPYLVSFESENSGNLRHDGGLDLIPYEMRMDEQQVNLGGSGDFVFPERTTSLGRVHRLRVQAGPATGRAGGYADRITVTVTAV
jgi:hypothetical protein